MSTDFLRVEGLAKTYPGAADPVFDGVNFGLAEGEFVCIIGHSGCGKTTILNVLAGLDSASSGHVSRRRMVTTTPRSASASGTNPRSMTLIVSHAGMNLRGYGSLGSPCRDRMENMLMSLHASAWSVVKTLR